MNSPSNRRPSWSWLLIGMIGCGLLLARMAGSFVTAQENPAASPPPASVQPPAPPPVVAPEFLPRPSANAERIYGVLAQPTEVDHLDIPLSDALIYLKELHDINIWLDKESLASEGIATDQLVTLSISGISLRSALRLLLEPLLVTYVVEDEVLKITTHEAASKLLVTRTYPVGDLFDSREEAHELVEVIVSGLGLRPKEKEVTPGNVSIKTLSFPVGGCGVSAAPRESGTFAVSVKARAIVARQTHAVHDEIRQLLRDLREAKALVPDRSSEPFEVPRTRTRPGAASSSPTPLDEFSPGLNPAPSTPRSIVPEPPERPASPEAAAPAKTKTGR